MKKDLVDQRDYEDKLNKYTEHENERSEEAKDILKGMHDYDKNKNSENVAPLITYEEMDNIISDYLLNNKSGISQSRFNFVVDADYDENTYYNEDKGYTMDHQSLKELISSFNSYFDNSNLNKRENSNK